MGETKVTQDDREAAADLVIDLQGYEEALDHKIRDGRADDHSAVVMAARHRQAAEKAQQERDAGIAEGYPSNEWHAIAIVRGIATAIRSQGHE